MERDYKIAALTRALQVLKLFDEDSKRMTLTELSQKAGINKSSMLRILTSFEAEGFIRYDADRRQYSLGIEIFKLANTAYEFVGIQELAYPYVRNAVEETGLIGHLGAVEDGHVVIISKVWPKSMTDTLVMQSRIGGVVPMHCTGVGKVLAAFSDHEQLERMLALCDFHRYTDKTLCSREALLPVLQQVRAQGYAVNSEEHEPYIKCVTYPIFDYNNRIVAAMSLTGIPQMYGPEKEAQVHKVLKSTVRLISNELGR